MPTAQEVGRAIARGIGPVARSVNPAAAGGALRRVLELAPGQDAVRRELERYEQHKRGQVERR